MVVVVTITSCVAVKLAIPSQGDIDRVHSKFPNYSLAELNQGKALFETKCNTCHGVKNPMRFKESEWNELVPKMVRKANKKGANIDDKSQELILKYVITMGTAPKN